jgi:hypothetical protein
MQNNLDRGVDLTEMTGEIGRGMVCDYHRKPSPLKKTTARQTDIVGMKSEDRRNLTFDGNTYQSKFTIGIEFEKNRLHRSSITEHALFCGFENDSSCGPRRHTQGYEAVTHIIPLVPKSIWRMKVFNMFHDAKKIIDDRFSPSNHRCGGHISIGVEDVSSDYIAQSMRKYSGLIYAIYRHRLCNHYCSKFNLFLDMTEDDCNSVYRKYCTMRVKRGGVVEWRLPSRFTSVNQTLRRYELFYEFTNFAINKPTSNLHNLCNAVKPILLAMYEQDSVKVEKVIKLAKKMQKVINSQHRRRGGKMCYETLGWFEGWWSSNHADKYGTLYNHYKRNFRNNPLRNRVTECKRQWKEEFYF